MFCFQCQETAKGTGCTIQGVCGKKADTSRWQDLLLAVTRGIGTIADSLRKAGVETSQEVGDYIVDSLFVTITNANFDDQAILAKVDKGVQLKRELLDLAASKNVTLLITKRLCGVEKRLIMKPKEIEKECYVPRMKTFVH